MLGVAVTVFSGVGVITGAAAVMGVDVRVTVGNDTAVDDIIGPDEPSDLSAGIQLTRTNKQAARVSNFFMPISQRGWLVV